MSPTLQPSQAGVTELSKYLVDVFLFALHISRWVVTSFVTTSTQTRSELKRHQMTFVRNKQG
jgi:hypothetical protein